MAQIIVRLKDRELQRVPVTCVATRIGRDVTNDVVIANDGVSRHHATLRYEAVDGAFVIHDAGSNNGIVVRGRATPYARLTDGDEVQVGKFTLVFVAEGGVAPDALAPESTPAVEPSAPVVRNPLPTVAVRAASSKKIAPARPAAPVPAPPPPAATASEAQPAPDDASLDPSLAAPARLLRRMIWLLSLVVALLGVVIALLLRR